MTAGQDEAGAPVGPTERMIEHVIAQLQEAKTAEPLRRLHALAGAQRHLAWATRWAVADERARGVAWTEIARFLGEKQHSTISRQFQARGPVVVARAGDDAQGPLRNAAAALMHAMVASHEIAESPIGQLYGPVRALSIALRNTQDPRPMLDEVAQILDRAAHLERGRARSVAAIGPDERHVQNTLTVLREVYRRDRDLIEAVAAIEPTE